MTMPSKKFCAELRANLDTYKAYHSPGVGKMGFYAKADDWDAVLAAIENARLAAEFFEVHGADMLEICECVPDKNSPDPECTDCAIHAALESTIAEFRKGAE